jgi:hypothetical protein
MARSKKSPRLDKLESVDWDTILKQVDKKEIPVTLIDYLLINFVNGDTVKIDVAEMLEDGADPDDIEDHLNKRLESLDHVIKDIDFHIRKDTIMKTVKPTTAKLLKKLS